MVKKWADPLERLLEANEKAKSVKEYLKTASPIDHTNNKSRKSLLKEESSVVDIDIKNILRWKYKDRPENELGDIKELSETFKSVGQQQPCILRNSKEFPGKYDLIVGERRWRAAEFAGVKLKAIIRDIDDKTAALIQAVENERRSDISEFAKGISYSDKIEKGLITQRDLTEILGISKQQVTRLLSYKKIPKPLFNAINDFRKVSSRTAYELVRLANKSEKNLQLLIEMSEKIKEGKYGSTKIEKELNKKLINKKAFLNKKITKKDGRHLFTWRLDNNSVLAIHFPKDISDLINKNMIDFEAISQEIKECISKKLSNLN